MTAYELRISDWSSDVCSSDLPPLLRAGTRRRRTTMSSTPNSPKWTTTRRKLMCLPRHDCYGRDGVGTERKSLVEGKSVSVRVELGGRRISKKKIMKARHNSEDEPLIDEHERRKKRNRK